MDNAYLLFGGTFFVALIILIIVELTKPSYYPVPYPPRIGGCAGTRWGCCADGVTPKSDPLGTNCNVGPAPIRPSRRLIGGCSGTRWGCCPDGVTAKKGPWDSC